MLTRYRPFGELSRADLWGPGWGELWGGERKTEAFVPAVDVVETDSAFVVTAEVPGVEPEQLELQVENGVLTLKGERKQEHEETREGYRRTERSYGQFQRSFTLPPDTDPRSVVAKAENGVLTVTVPKPQPEPKATAYKVEVKAKEKGFAEKAKATMKEAMSNPLPTM